MCSPIEKKLPSCPTQPGVYIMKGEDGAVLYVGKAKNLRARLQSYVREGADNSPKTRLLLKRVHAVDLLVTHTEKEALLLENSLIKKHRPRYNILLVDDKTYLHILVDRNHPFPRFVPVRRPGPPKAGQQVFGPYSSAHAVRDTLRQIHKLYPLRTCKDREFSLRKRPCLQAQMGRCGGACVGHVTPEAYGEMVDQAVLILQGRNDELIRRQEKLMQEASESMNFEEAARIRDRIRAVRLTMERQGVVDVRAPDRDVIGCAVEGDVVSVADLQMRGGNLVDSKAYVFHHVVVSMGELLRSFLMQVYSETGMKPPREILLFDEPDDHETLEELLGERRGGRCSLKVPRRGEKKRLIELAALNAQALLEERTAEDRGRMAALREIERKLSMPAPPDRVECFDISNLQGALAVGSRVVFIQGRPDKQLYRRYRIRLQEGIDDYGMMYEVLTRRFSSEREAGDLPDLLLVDGGKGHLNVACRVLQDLCVQGPSAAAIAKGADLSRDAEVQASDRIFVPGRANPVAFSKRSGGLRLLQQVRDEAHRFAVAYHRTLRSRELATSWLDVIPGIGPKRKRALLEELGSVEEISKAPVRELANVPGMTQETALHVWRHFHPEET